MSNDAVPTSDLVTKDDLRWWLDKAAALEWTWARTYADTAPHHYVVEGRTEGMTHDDYVRAARVIRTFGQPGQYWGWTNIYLEHDGRKWWTMDEPLEKTGLINMADADQVYGPQEVPSTVTTKEHFYDRVATVYDDMWLSPTDHEENAAVRTLVSKHFGAYAPTTLDVGCGTGLLLDLGITSPRIYTGVDPSQGMLNQLVKKHPKVQRLFPGTASEVLPRLTGERFELVTSLFASPSYMVRDDWEAMLGMTDSLLVLMTYEKDYLPQYWAGTDELPMIAAQCESARVGMIEFAKDHGARRFVLNRFDVTVVEKR